MTRARRFIATFAAATAVAAIPGAAAAQPVDQCVHASELPVSPGSIPVIYVCVSHDPEYGTQVLWRIDETKYSLWRDGDGTHFCMYGGGGTSCPLP